MSLPCINAGCSPCGMVPKDQAYTATDVKNLQVQCLNVCDVVFTNQALISDGTAAAPGLAFTSDPNTGIFLNAAGNLAVSDESQEVAEFNSVGTAVEVNVGGEGTVTDVAFNVGNGATADDVSINMLSSAAGGSVHITAAQGTAPAAVAGGGFAGATSTATSTDLAGTVDFTSAAGAGTIAITYATAYATTPHVVVTPGIGDTFTALQVSANATTGFTISATGTAAVAAQFMYHVIA